MNDVIKNIVERRSIKKYKSDMVPTELIDEVLKAGTYAPSGMNRQSPIIIAITKSIIVTPSSLLYLFLCSSDYSKLIAIEVKASSVDKQENEESKVVPD